MGHIVCHGYHLEYRPPAPALLHQRLDLPYTKKLGWDLQRIFPDTRPMILEMKNHHLLVCRGRSVVVVVATGHQASGLPQYLVCCCYGQENRAPPSLAAEEGRRRRRR